MGSVSRTIEPTFVGEDGIVYRVRPCGTNKNGMPSAIGATLVDESGNSFTTCGRVLSVDQFSRDSGIDHAYALCQACNAEACRLSDADARKSDLRRAHAEISRRHGRKWSDERVQEHGAVHGLTGGRLTGEQRWRIALATFDDICVDDVCIPFGVVATNNLAKGRVRHLAWRVARAVDGVKARWPDRNMRLVDYEILPYGNNGQTIPYLTFEATIDDVTDRRSAYINNWDSGQDPFAGTITAESYAPNPAIARDNYVLGVVDPDSGEIISKVGRGKVGRAEKNKVAVSIDSSVVDIFETANIREEHIRCEVRQVLIERHLQASYLELGRHRPLEYGAFGRHVHGESEVFAIAPELAVKARNDIGQLYLLVPMNQPIYAPQRINRFDAVVGLALHASQESVHGKRRAAAA